MKPTTFRARIEPLESRETPSSAAAGVHELAQHFAAFRGTGTAVTQSQIQTATGVERFTTLSGRSNLGDFTGGALSDFASANATQGTSTLTFFTQSGDQIGATGTVTLGATNARAHTVRTTIRFTILGGTGAFVNTSGSGTITGIQNLATGVLRFNLSGRIAVI